MTIRTNTVEYFFTPLITSLAGAVRHTFTAITLDIPENNTRTFLSVVAEVTVRDMQVATASRGSISSHTIGCQLAAIAVSDSAVADTITDSGEQVSFVFHRDFTSYFNTNFGSGASQTCNLQFIYAQSAGTVLLSNITAKLIITYQYEDTGQTTFVKTVRIPIESPAGALTNTAPPPQIGTNQVPALDTFCPEAGKSYKNIVFTVFGNQSNTGTNDGSLGIALDGAAETVFTPVFENANNSSTWVMSHWVQNAMTTDVTHTIGLRTSDTVAGTWNHIAIVLVVTYTYTITGTTRFLNSIMVPVDFNGLVPGTANTDRKRYRRSLYLSEPGSFTLRQSGVVLHFDAPSNANLLVACAAQAFRTYTVAAGSLTCGMLSVCQRIDSGGAQGAGITLGASGTATDVIVDIYAATTDVLSNVSGFMILNYESDLATIGGTGKPGLHATTRCKILRATAADGVVETVAATAATTIPDTEYWLMSVAPQLWHLQATAVTFVTIEMELAAGEDDADGWRTIFADLRSSDAELGLTQSTTAARVAFRRHASDPDATRANSTATRRWRIHTSASAWKSFLSWYTYHAHEFNVTGVVSGSSGGTVNLTLFDAVTHEVLETGSRVGNGSYTLVWHDARQVYAVARESGTLLGRTDNGAGTRVT